MGQDAQERWSSACGELCIHLPAQQSSEDDALQMDHTAKEVGRLTKVELKTNKASKHVLKLVFSFLIYIHIAHTPISL